MGYLFSNFDELDCGFILPRQNVIVKHKTNYYTARYLGDGKLIKISTDDFLGKRKEIDIITDKTGKQKSNNFKILPYSYEYDVNSEEVNSEEELQELFKKYGYCEKYENLDDVESADNNYQNIVKEAYEKTSEIKKDRARRGIEDISFNPMY